MPLKFIYPEGAGGGYNFKTPAVHHGAVQRGHYAPYRLGSLSPLAGGAGNLQKRLSKVSCNTPNVSFKGMTLVGMMAIG